MLLTTCTNPFSTRQGQVEDPVTQSSGSTLYDPALNADQVFSNFAKAMQEHNVEEYMRCFIPLEEIGNPHVFRFQPDPHFINELDQQSWDLTDERDYFTKLSQSQKGNYPYLDLVFNNNQPIPLTPITATSINDSLETGSISYRLTIHYSPDSLTVYNGEVNFRLYKIKEPPETWHIYRWEDYAKEDQYDRCWTALKLFYRK